MNCSSSCPQLRVCFIILWDSQLTFHLRCISPFSLPHYVLDLITKTHRLSKFLSGATRILPSVAHNCSIMDFVATTRAVPFSSAFSILAIQSLVIFLPQCACMVCVFNNQSGSRPFVSGDTKRLFAATHRLPIYLYANAFNLSLNAQI